MVTWKIALVTMVVTILGSGCGASSRNDGAARPAPGTKSRKVADAGSGASQSGRSKDDEATVIRVFYGTDRERANSGSYNNFYSSNRGPLEFGHCDVSIPATHETGKLEAPRLWKLEFRENPDKHVMLVGVEATNGDQFLKELKSAIAESSEREAFVFVHGYNVTFKDAARRTAQIAYDLKFSGAPIMFSWPAQGDLEDYTVDENSAIWAEPHVTQFLEAVALASGAKKIHLIAHSMGNRLVAKALERMVRQPSFGVIPEFNQIVLTAPDIDADVFKRDIAPNIVQAAERVVIYASGNDRALGASRKVHGYPRLGQAGAAICLFPEFPKIEVVDASGVDTSLFSLRHSYYASNETVLVDLARVLQGLRPNDRGLLSQKGGAFWTLQKAASTASGAARERQ